MWLSDTMPIPPSLPTHYRINGQGKRVFNFLLLCLRKDLCTLQYSFERGPVKNPLKSNPGSLPVRTIEKNPPIRSV
jgi:hypothetical protein